MLHKCPYEAIHLYDAPKYCSIFLHLAGDSTITKYFVNLYLSHNASDDINYYNY